MTRKYFEKEQLPKVEFHCWRTVEVLLVNLSTVMTHFLLILSASQSYSPPNSAPDSKPQGRPQSGPQLTHYSPLPPIHMPKLRQESRSGKSLESEAVTYSDAGTPVAGTKFEGTRPSTGGAHNGQDNHIGLISPEILPVR